MFKHAITIKYIYGATLAVMVALFLAPQLLLAQATATKTPEQRCREFADQFNVTNELNGQVVGSNLVNEMPRYCTITQLLSTIIQILLALAGTVAVVFIIIGGFQYMTASGNDEQAEKGRKTLTNAIIGLVVILLASVIVRIVANTVAGRIFGDPAPATQNNPGGNNAGETVRPGSSGEGTTSGPGGRTESGTPEEDEFIEPSNTAMQSANNITFTVTKISADTFRVNINGSPSDKLKVCGMTVYSRIGEGEIEIFANGESVKKTTADRAMVDVAFEDPITGSVNVTVNFCGYQIGGGSVTYTSSAR